jgi:hypothetical protein
VSRQTEAKKARCNKRRAARDANWIPEPLLNELVDSQGEQAAELELFDERITERGWTFDDEFSEEGFASWFYAPSGAEVPEPHMETVARICASDKDSSSLPDGSAPFPEAVSVFLVGDNEILTFAPDDLLENLDAVEAYRFGDPPPFRQGLVDSCP